MAPDIKTPVRPPGNLTYVDSVESLQSFIQKLAELVNHPSATTLYLDLEGINLSRNGTISLLTLLVPDDMDGTRVFLVDVHTLGSSAFSTLSTRSPLCDQATCFKDILESPKITKILFDVRNDADALYSHFRIKMQNVTDLQLMENAARASAGQGARFVHGLAKCVRVDSTLSKKEKNAWEIAKDRGQQLYAPEKGGHYEIFNERPLKEDIKVYCL
jgi:exonuclease 3'-5' domain-containing protein 1